MTPSTKTDQKTPSTSRSPPCCRAGDRARAAATSRTSTDGNGAGAPAALFVHGVLVNADLWRNVIWDVADMRRCIAPDLPAHGATPASAG